MTRGILWRLTKRSMCSDFYWFLGCLCPGVGGVLFLFPEPGDVGLCYL